MSQGSPQFIVAGPAQDQRRLATLVSRGAPAGPGPGLMWLPGLMSDMSSTKASAMAGFAEAHGLASTRFDYSGHGQSEGRFADGTIGRWLEDAETVFTELTSGPQILVGSSMGGYIALLMLKRMVERGSTIANRIMGMVLIAPAWDMTEELMWNEFPVSVKTILQRDGVWPRPSPYGAPYPITMRLIEEGRTHLLARKTFRPGCPVHIIHGLIDPDVPWEHTMDLMSFLDGPDIGVTAVPEGEHRLSRPEDIALILDTIGRMVAGIRSSGRATT